jgi:carboxyl-terminal processing protease
MRRVVFVAVFVCVCAILVASQARAEYPQSPSFEDYFEEIWRLAVDRYIKPIEDSPQARMNCLVGMVGHGLSGCLSDDYAEFYPKKEVRSLMAEVSGETGGIGLGLKRRGGFVRIMTIIPNSPAARSEQFAVGDAILEVEGEDVQDATAEMVAGMIMGDSGTTARIKVKRRYEELPLIVVTRKTIVVPSIEKRLIGDIMVLKISFFRRNTPWIFEEIVKKAATDQGIGKFVVDLRDNPGGLVGAVVDMACLFSNDRRDVIMTIMRRAPEDFQVDDVAAGCGIFGRGKFKKLRFTILVNQDSASGSELFAALAKDWGFAKVIGTPTYGKGSVQTTFELSDGSFVKFTVAEYCVGNNCAKVDGVGVVPDIEVPAGLNEKGDDAQMAAALGLLKE